MHVKIPQALCCSRPVERAAAVRDSHRGHETTITERSAPRRASRRRVCAHQSCGNVNGWASQPRLTPRRAPDGTPFGRYRGLFRAQSDSKRVLVTISAKTNVFIHPPAPILHTAPRGRSRADGCGRLFYPMRRGEPTPSCSAGGRRLRGSSGGNPRWSALPAGS